MHPSRLLTSAALIPVLALLVAPSGCAGDTPPAGPPHAYELGTIGGFAELVNSGVKTLAMSEVLSPSEMDAMLPEAEKVAARNKVQLYRERRLLVTDLFPADVAKDKDVLLIYQGGTLDEYLALKSEAEALEKAGRYTGKAREDIARRFGRLLSYPTWRINQLLAQNTAFRTMRDFGIRASNAFFYYRDLERATAFYRDVLGLEIVADYDMARIVRVADTSYLVLVDATRGMHTADEPKSVALALLTDELEAWHTYLGSRNIAPGRPFAARQGSAHDGFVIKDPEGYLLEFERFNQHPENERFLPLLKANQTIRSPKSPLPEGLGFKATILWLYYKDLPPMQTFYEEVLGLRQVVDQGWAKIYEGSKTGHVGLVDERRGMNRWTDTKAVNVSFLIDDIDGWFTAVKDRELFPLRGTAVSDDEAGRYRAFVGYDPEGYYMEFDVFRTHPVNTTLMGYLGSPTSR
jgi:catechol 2,3-dioxygenase-like lactoylglutathione lyase family enzyme